MNFHLYELAVLPSVLAAAQVVDRNTAVQK
jgi:hypothetical protein